MTRSSTVKFAKHYVEMVLVMLAGMFVLGGALLLIAAALGASPDDLQEDAPGLLLLGMGFSMTAPMVWWMPRRGHTWAATRAMAVAMILPTAATILFLVTGAIDDLGTLFGIEHVAMFPAMFIAMLPYRTEYTQTHVKTAS
jgi:cytochrome bd-type quinol oxidase subunit 2